MGSNRCRVIQGSPNLPWPWFPIIMLSRDWSPPNRILTWVSVMRGSCKWSSTSRASPRWSVRCAERSILNESSRNPLNDRSRMPRRRWYCVRHLTQSQKHTISKNRRLFPTYGTSCRGWFLNLKKELTKLKIRWCPSYNRGELMLRSYKQ